MMHMATAGQPVTRGVTSVAMLCWTLACGGPSQTGPSDGGNSNTTLTPVAQTAEWPTSTADAESLDTVRLTDAVNRIRRGEYGRINSLLIARNEQLVVEEYFNGWTAAVAHTQQSVTKSVASLAAGLAIDRGSLRLTDPVTAYFPDYQPIAAFDANKAVLTVRDLLTMRTGLDWTEQQYGGSPLERLNTCSCDWIRFMLDWRMREPPGARFEYVSGGVILLGAVVGRATGTRVDQWLDTTLFAALGVQAVRWERGLPDGLPHSGGGLYLRPRDMAKIGTLAATGGRWQGRQVVSGEWMRLSTQTLPDVVNNFGGRPATYGYLWWGLPGGVIAASGARGQWILAVPDRQLVIASTAENSNAQWAAPVQILYDHVLPAARQ
jgi:CubicO group peptidase (beta-lactamase class C family)